MIVDKWTLVVSIVGALHKLEDTNELDMSTEEVAILTETFYRSLLLKCPESFEAWKDLFRQAYSNVGWEGSASTIIIWKFIGHVVIDLTETHNKDCSEYHHKMGIGSGYRLKGNSNAK